MIISSYEPDVTSTTGKVPGPLIVFDTHLDKSSSGRNLQHLGSIKVLSGAQRRWLTNFLTLGPSETKPKSHKAKVCHRLRLCFGKNKLIGTLTQVVCVPLLRVPLSAAHSYHTVFCWTSFYIKLSPRGSSGTASKHWTPFASSTNATSREPLFAGQVSSPNIFDHPTS